MPVADADQRVRADLDPNQIQRVTRHTTAEEAGSSTQPEPASRPLAPRLDEPHERPDHTIEQRSERGLERRHPTKRLSGLETSQSLPSRSRRGLITNLPILASRVSTFRKIKRNARQSPLQLIGKRPTASPQHRKVRSNQTNQLEHNRINSKHDQHSIVTTPSPRGRPRPPAASAGRVKAACLPRQAPAKPARP
jgi:hypothetical protein